MRERALKLDNDSFVGNFRVPHSSHGDDNRRRRRRRQSVHFIWWAVNDVFRRLRVVCVFSRVTVMVDIVVLSSLYYVIVVVLVILGCSLQLS